MASIQEIGRMIRERKLAIRAFIHEHGAKPFYGQSRRGEDLAVTRELNPQKLGQWRVTYFSNGEPVGHTEARNFAEAVNLAVREFGFDLRTAKHLPSASRDRARRRARRR